MSAVFKRTILLSFLGHITVFSLFSFSFGNKIPKLDYAAVNFWGAILRRADLIPLRQTAGLRLNRADISLLEKADNKPQSIITNFYLKPAADLVFPSDKMAFAPELNLAPPVTRRKEPVMMFYPQLPYHFLLYFQDRQAVHIEVALKIVSEEKRNLAVIKRKVSSGNLEADLLALRYIGHYLFVQQAGFPKDTWQTIKVDLSAKGAD